jgi:hypothetical protein
MVEWPPLPPQDEIMAMFEEAKRRAQYEREFWQANYEQLRYEHPDRFVAIKDGRVIDSDTDHGTLLQRLRDAGLGRPEVWTDFVPREPRRYLL